MDRWERDRFWKGFAEYMTKGYAGHAPRGAAVGSRLVIPPMWHSGAARVAVGINWPNGESTIQVDLTLNVKRNKPLTLDWYKTLVREKGLKERLVTQPGELWKTAPRPDKAESWVVVKKRAFPEEEWAGHYAWLAGKAVRFHEVLGPLVAGLPRGR